MDRSPLRVVVVALVLAAILGAVPAAAAQSPAPKPTNAKLAALACPGASLARLVAWVVGLLPGAAHDRGLASAGSAGGRSGRDVHAEDGSAPDPNG